MRSRNSATIAGFCRQCHSDVQLANRIYSCRCGSTSDESYDSPPSWVFQTEPGRETTAAAETLDRFAHAVKQKSSSQSRVHANRRSLLSSVQITPPYAGLRSPTIHFYRNKRRGQPKWTNKKSQKSSLRRLPM
jgi:hypothetical protein